MSDRESTALFRSKRYDEASENLKKGLAEQGENGRDLLLYLLDLGLSLHSAGKYEESNKYLLQADKIAEIKDYTSLATEGATLLVSENLKDYKGEDFEKVLINTYLAINYALLGNFEDALVEARRVNHKLLMMVSEGGRNYEQNGFARYLSAVIYEAEGNWNDAYIDYKNTYKLVPDYPSIGRDLWRMAFAMRMRDEMDQWDEEFKLTAQDHEKAKLQITRPGRSEIVVIYENGISPIKRPNPHFSSLPRFYPRFNPVYAAEITLQKEGETLHLPTAKLYDVEATAIKNLDDKYAGLIAKKIAGVVAKETVAYEVEKHTKDPLLGLATRLFLYVADQADLRSWNLLPRDFQIARIPVPPGTYTVRATASGAEPIGEKTVEVSVGKKVFVDFRYMP